MPPNRGVHPVELAPVRDGDELDSAAAEHLLPAASPRDPGAVTTVRQFPNGPANLTYLLEFADASYVLRRPPFGVLPAGGHDMIREHRVLSRLWIAYDRAPHSYLLCQDPAVLGADFQVIEYRRGQVLWATVPPLIAHHQDVGRRLGPRSRRCAGGAPCGRTRGLRARRPRPTRRLPGPSGRRLAGAVGPRHRPRSGLDGRCAERLRSTRPRPRRVAILHNDFKLDNCQFSPALPDRVRSVFDLDMATPGDPMVDLGILLNYWPDPIDGLEAGLAIPSGLDSLGLPTRQQLVETYVRAGGDIGDGVSWYDGFVAWKTAVVLRQLYVRYAAGHSNDARQAAKGALVDGQARRAARLLGVVE